MASKNQNIYRSGGGGGLGSYIVVIYRSGTGNTFTTDASWKQMVDSYVHAETLLLSVIELDQSYRVWNLDIVRETNQLKFVALDTERSKLYTLTSDGQGSISVTETDAGGGGSITGDLTYEEI